MKFLSILSPILVLLVFLPSSLSSSSSSAQVLINNVCNQVTNYTFCVEILNSDPRAQDPNADNNILAYISFGLAFQNATDTLSHIKYLLKNATRNKDVLDSMEGLQKCKSDYSKAVSSVEEAYNELNSETYSGLADLVSVASKAAAACEGAFNNTTRGSPLRDRNNGLRGLCEICVVVSNLLT
ncbi:hypothetical protein ACHQM5_029077 [Ranunculus cassubicifolius]